MSTPQGKSSAPPAPAQTAPGPGTHDATGNLMRGPEGRTARLTVISVLLGAMVAAIVAGLPPTPAVFARSLLTGDHLVIDLQVLAMLLFVFDMWITFSWATILGVTPFDFVGNLMVFLIAVMAIGWALSVSEIRAWLGWYVALGVAGGINLLISRFMRHAHIPLWRLVLYAACLLVLTYAALNANGVVPAWATSSAPSLLWVAVVLVSVIVDLGAITEFLRAYQQGFARLPR